MKLLVLVKSELGESGIILHAEGKLQIILL